MTTTTAALSAPVGAPQTARVRLLTPGFARLLAVDLGAMTGFYLLLAVVPMHASAHGADGLGAGLTTAVLMFASVAGELATPRVAARVGYRRLLVAGLVLLGAPAFALVWVTGLVPMLLVGVVRGLGFAVVVTATGALAAATLPVERRGEGLGLMGVVSMVPAVTALPAGVWLAGSLGTSAAFVLGAVAVLAVVPVCLGLPRDTEEHEAESGLGSLARRPGTVAPAVVFAVAAVAGGAVVSFLPGAVAGHAGLAAVALFVQALTATAARYAGGRRSDRHGPHALLVPGVALVATGMGLAALTGSPAAVLLGMAAFGTGFGLVQTASLNLMLGAATPAQYGAVSAAWNVAYDLGWGLGAAAVGVLVTSVGFPVAFAATAVAAVAMLPLAAATARVSRGGGE
jgi:predicted MFS family arabinose efflux permease